MKRSQPFISIVTPVYRSEASLRSLYNRIKKALEGSLTQHFELIMVDDNSPGKDWAVIKELAMQDSRVKGIRLTRNMGQYAAITAGLDVAKGQWVVIIDCDLQDQPEEIPHLYQKALEGFDIVLAQRVNRQDNVLKRLSSWLFHQLFYYLTDVKQDPTTAQFGIYHHRVIQAFTGMRERLRYLPAFIQWTGFKKALLPVTHAAREHSPSSYSLRKLILLATDTCIAFSDKPLRLCIRLGFGMALLSFGYALYLISEAMSGRANVEGWSSLMVSIWFLSGLMISIMGLIGLYVAKIFDEVKCRPLYIIQDVCENSLMNAQEALQDA